MFLTTVQCPTGAGSNYCPLQLVPVLHKLPDECDISHNQMPVATAAGASGRKGSLEHCTSLVSKTRPARLRDRPGLYSAKASILHSGPARMKAPSPRPGPGPAPAMLKHPTLRPDTGLAQLKDPFPHLRLRPRRQSPSNNHYSA